MKFPKFKDEEHHDEKENKLLTKEKISTSDLFSV